MTSTKFAKYLASLGYGSRREVTRLLEQGRVTHRDGTPFLVDDAFVHQDVLVDDEPLDSPPGSLLMLNKPLGYVCSTKDASRLVYELLPSRFRDRSPVMAPIGRLDRDSSGLLLLTDDGQLNHRITSPRTHLPKVYDALLAGDLRGDEEILFASGTLMLDGEEQPLKPARLEMIDARHVRVTITEGRYHQVRRMFATVDNHVVALHRSAIGGLELGDLASGSWRLLSTNEALAISAPTIP